MTLHQFNELKVGDKFYYTPNELFDAHLPRNHPLLVEVTSIGVYVETKYVGEKELTHKFYHFSFSQTHKDLLDFGYHDRDEMVVSGQEYES
jgi:hypothetical protein